jgi:hypothetical protein
VPEGLEESDSAAFSSSSSSSSSGMVQELTMDADLRLARLELDPQEDELAFDMVEMGDMVEARPLMELRPLSLLL